MKVFRASYSTLSAWANGEYDRALGMYFHTTDFDTPAMQLGRALHDEWDHEIKATGCMPAVFGGAKLPPDFKSEIFATKMLAPWLQLRGKLDLNIPSEYIAKDWKSGITPANDCANTMQHCVYHVLYPSLKKFEYHAFNPYARASEAVTVAIVHLTDATKTAGIEWIITHASAMKDYIETNNLEAQFEHLKKVKRS